MAIENCLGAKPQRQNGHGSFGFFDWAQSQAELPSTPSRSNGYQRMTSHE
jgi:hypothetical protein